MDYEACSVDGCEAKVKAKGYCQNHYYKFKKNGDPLMDRRKIPKGRTCAVDGCDKPHASNGMCGMHAQRVRRNGSPHVGARVPVEGCCSVDSCSAPAYCKGLCHGHYCRSLRGAPLDTPVRQRNNPTETHKICPNCRENKEHSQFAKANGRLASWCKECHKHYLRRLHYGLSRDEYALLSANGCAACGGLDKLVVDHHHGTGVVRGVLCSPCNVALGMLQDSPERIDALARYLRSA